MAFIPRKNRRINEPMVYGKKTLRSMTEDSEHTGNHRAIQHHRPKHGLLRFPIVKGFGSFGIHRSNPEFTDCEIWSSRCLFTNNNNLNICGNVSVEADGNHEYTQLSDGFI